MEEVNKINLKEQFLKMYVKEATYEQLQQINTLLEQENYKQIDKIIEEYTHNIINNEDLKDVNQSGGGNLTSTNYKEDFSTEDMDSQTFELFCILALIDKYEKEYDKSKKEILYNEIQMAIKRYRNPDDLTPRRSK